MKKLIALVMTLALLLSLTTVATAAGVTDLTDYLGVYATYLYNVAPPMTVNESSSAYTANFELWIKLENDRISAISIESSEYSLYGIAPGMSVDAAARVLNRAGIDFEDQGTELWANSMATGLSYISAEYADGRITEVMCGAVDLDTVSPDLAGASSGSASDTTVSDTSADTNTSGTYSYATTAACAAAFDANSWSYDLIGLISNGNERIATNFTTNNYGSVTLRLDFSSDEDDVFVCLYDLITFDSSNFDAVARVCNDLNNENLYARFVADASDNTVYLEIDSILALPSAGETCTNLVAAIITLADDAYESLSPYIA